jgi:signal peptidase II
VTTDSGKRRKSGRAVHIVAFAVLVGLDQILKALVAARMNIGETIPVIGSFVRISYVVNYGISFSLFEGHPGAVLVLQTVIFAAFGAIFLAAFVGRIRVSAPAFAGLTATLAGGIGNLIDRYIHGYVIDFISVGTFPVWNFADMCIVGGCALLALSIIIDKGDSFGKGDAGQG